MSKSTTLERLRELEATASIRDQIEAAQQDALEEAAKIVESAVAPPGVLGTVLIQSDELAARIRSRAKRSKSQTRCAK